MTEASEQKFDFVVDTTAVQVQLKVLIRNDILLGVEPQKTFDKAKAVIRRYSAKIKKLEIRREFEISLARDFKRWYATFASGVLAVFKFFMRKGVLVSPKKTSNGKIEITLKVYQDGKEIEPTDIRLPIDKYRTKVKSEYAKLINEMSEDEAKSTAHGSLRNRAEVHIRWQEQQNSLEDLRDKGQNLVWSSSHADASVRCTPWQGRLYSLDGTSGKIDGISYIPLTTAMRGTKADGNGLLGYNCRHRLIPYTAKSTAPSDYTSETLRRERAIDQEQRKMERSIRKAKEKGFLLQGVDGERSRAYFDKAKEKTDAYKKYSAGNNREYYIYRTQIMREEIKHIKQ